MKQHRILGLSVLAGAAMVFSIMAIFPVNAERLPTPLIFAATPYPDLVTNIASQTGIDPALVQEMLASGIQADEIDQELALEWPEHLALLAEKNQRRQHAGLADPQGERDIVSTKEAAPDFKTNQ